MSDCIFCRMAAGEIPVSYVYEDEHVVAFDDISPQAPVHTLIVPRRHVVNLSDPASEEVMREVFSAVPKVAKVKGVSESGYRVIVNNGPDANQTVQHLHVHVMGGREMAHGMVTFSEE
ncbi:MAG TPA: histidine triad nucleotide-binding protein [Coriobacteriia bacterium]|nr:histidine triad nucleotide-binding protein [Coriobacteriia bacterium]